MSDLYLKWINKIIEPVPKRKKVWSRKGRCPVCKVGTGSKHSKNCNLIYEDRKPINV